MSISVGDGVPAATLRELGEGGIEEVSTRDLLAGRRVALFGIPGAFTPTCSAQHLPGFVHNAAALKAKGIDEIVCMAVNDAFVMKAWGDAQGVGDSVRMLADGNAELAKAMGLGLDASGFGMGTRCQRFSMVIDDGMVQSLEIDPPGTFRATSAEAMLDAL